jgi:hypothetical protein
MLLKDYFKQVNGTGVLSTADAEGNVNSAIYSKPIVTEDGCLAFLMRERQSWRNVEENPHANFMFIENGTPYQGLRIRLQEVGEEKDSELVKRMTRGWLSPEEDAALGPKHLVLFRIEQIRNLVGDGEPGMTWN